MRAQSISFVLFLFLILDVSGRAANNTLIFSGGINHHFSTAVTEQPASRPGFIDAYSVSMQYNRKINGAFGAGFRTMFHNFNAMQEEGVNAASIPVFLTLNYHVFEIDAGNHVQFAAGPVFNLNSAEGFESEEIKKSFKTGYGIGLFSGYSLGIWGLLSVNAEGGLLYEKYSFKNTVKNNSNITALFSLGFALNY